MANILLVTDDNGLLASSVLVDNGRVDNQELAKHLEKYGHTVSITKVNEADNHSGYIVYASSEDCGSFYKNYIEDKLLFLSRTGCVLIPSFDMFRAHHNKAYMELIRQTLPEEYRTIRSIVVYSKEEGEEAAKRINQYPIVIKTAEGSGSEGVRIANSEKECVRLINKMGRVSYKDVSYGTKDEIINRLTQIKRKYYHQQLRRWHQSRQKLILQQFISDLLYDYKVLVFGEKYYILKREVRKNDFRASGSGHFVFPEELNEEITATLEYVKRLYEELKVPMLSVDVAYDGTQNHLIEFQGVFFGPYTLQRSSGYYIKKTNWEYVIEKSVLEEEMARSINRYIDLSGRTENI